MSSRPRRPWHGFRSPYRQRIPLAEDRSPPPVQIRERRQPEKPEEPGDQPMAAEVVSPAVGMLNRSRYEDRAAICA
ncbi:hypothetical protein GCM10025883_02790 [Mobilicoccus caccae]|uniref:Uncharacterized protein n=1 Tax=Mobilicoccus caccae TaxID=1859295 RepID=A0ABQ6INE6_9MICO|nr:hypothetical protein GCM10025883_02790 [Mobilicoccus caccae]